VIVVLISILTIRRYVSQEDTTHDAKAIQKIGDITAEPELKKANRDVNVPSIDDKTLTKSTSYLQQDIIDLAHIDEDVIGMIEPRLELMIQLNEVLPYDREKAAKYDIPEKDMATTQSDVLCRHFAYSPIRVWFGLYDDRNIGIFRSLRASNTLATLYAREDIIPAIIKFYKETPIEPEKMQDLKPSKVSLALKTVDEFVMYPPVFNKVAGFEEELLRHLCDRYRRLDKVNSLNPDEPVYGVVHNTTKELALRLVERVRPSLYKSLASNKTIKSEPQFYARIEAMLGE
jgi:hypothetical protein